MPTKLLLYTHNGLGLGHLSGLLKIAGFLQAEIGDLSILLLTESAQAYALSIPPGTDVVKFPGVLKTKDVAVSRALPLPFKDVAQLRERIIQATALAYQPHFFLVDYKPLGVEKELLSTLRILKDKPNKPVVVCGLLDMEESSDVRKRWQKEGEVSALEALYDEIWVYGCQALFDPIKEYQLPDAVAAKVRFCGYLGIAPPARSPEAIRRELGIGQGKLVLVTVGGQGWDGFPVLDAYLRALECLPKDQEVHSILFTGPDMPPEQCDILRQRCHRVASSHPGSPHIRLLEFSPQLLDYMAVSDVIVTRGGYNTVTEILSLGKQAIVIPRISPNREQFIRAALFERKGLIRMLHPDQLSPEALAEALLVAFSAPPLLRQHLEAEGLTLNGLESVRGHFLRLLAEREEPGNPER